MSQYVLIPKSTLQFDKPSVFALYVRLNDRMVKVLKEGEVAEAARIDSYLSKKDDVLYIESAMIERFMDEKFAGIFDEVTGKGPIEVRLRSFIRCMELCYLDIKLVRPSMDKFMRLVMSVDPAYDFFKNAIVQNVMLKMMVDTVESPVSRRALVGASFSMAMYFANHDCPLRTFRSVFVGGLLRDVGLSLIDGRDPHDMVLESDPARLALFHDHPAQAIKILQEYKICDDTIEAMIRQHHEKPMGNGFPAGLKRAEIFKPAMNLHLADWLMDLLRKSSDARGKIDREAALEKLLEELPEEYHRHVVVLNGILSTALGVKPGRRAS